MSVAHTAILGCGNPNRTDDGVGPAVIAMLHEKPIPEGVLAADMGTDGMGILYQTKGISRLIIVDAKAPEDSPGAIFKVPGEALEAPPPNSFNLHDFRWDHAIYAGKKIYGDEFPDDVMVFLIEAENLDLGLGLTSDVQLSAQKVVAEIYELIVNE